MVLGGSMVGLVFEVVIKRNAIKILHDDVEVVVGLDYIQYLHNVWVTQHLKYSYLPSH